MILVILTVAINFYLWRRFQYSVASPLLYFLGFQVFYILFPLIFGPDELPVESMQDSKLHISSLLIITLYTIFFFVGFLQRIRFVWNLNISVKRTRNVILYLVCLCFIYFYIDSRGFAFFWSYNSSDFDTGGLSQYKVQLVGVLPVILSIGYLNNKNVTNKAVILLLGLLTLNLYLVSGFRYRIVIMGIIGVGVISYGGLSQIRRLMLIAISTAGLVTLKIMELIRSYSRGLDFGAIQNDSLYALLSTPSMEYGVFWYTNSLLEKNYFWGAEPLWTAILMPFPRSILPFKPDGGYLVAMQLDILGTSNFGIAHFFWAELQIAYSYLGLGIAFLVGMLLRTIWNSRNLSVVNWIVLFSSNALIFTLLPRGYLAGNFTTIMIYIFLPLLLLKLINMKV